MLHEDGKNSAHFVDSFGFTGLPDFMRELEGMEEREKGETEPEAPQEEAQDTSGHDVQKPEAEKAEQKSYPDFYGHTLVYAMEHGEVDKYMDSRKLDRECKEAVEGTIRQNFDGMHLKHDIVKPLAEQYGSDRIAFILANTIQQESWDGRFSRDNKVWAAEFYIPENLVHGIDMNRELIVSSHPAVLDGFIDMFRMEVLEKEKEMSAAQEKEPDTSGHDVNHSAKQNDLKSESEQTDMEQPKPEPAQTEQPKPEKEEHQETERPEPQQEGTPETKQAELQSEQNKPEKADKTQIFEDMEDEDEIIDLGDEKDQVLARMKKSLNGEQETELAFQIADRFISIQEVDGGYDYSIMGVDYKEIDGGVYDNPDVSIREALDDILTDLKDNPFDNGARGNIRDNDELIPIDYDGLMEKVEAVNRIEPQAQGNVVENFKAKTNELFYEISEMNPAEIEETVKCHVQAQLDESGIDAEIVDMAVVGSRCRGLEQEGSDLDVVVEFSTSEREDVCGEFHNLGEFYENIPTVEEAVAIWKQIPPERMNGIPAIGIHIHTPGTEAFEDVGIDILSGKRIDLDILEYIPDIKGNPQAMEMIAELVAKLPEMEIDGNMSEEMEARVWEMRMPDLTPAEQLAVEIDRFIYGYDTALYHDNNQSMTENVSEIAEALNQRDTRDMALWFAGIAADGTEPEERKRAMELLGKLAEYKPLAKIEEMEEQNYNMVDNVLNNGAGEKAQKEENKKAQDRPAAKPSLKARLAEKKAQVAGQGREQEENIKNKQREM